MSTELKRIMLTLLPEWEPDLEQLKKEKFFNTSYSKMYQYLISIALETEKQNINKNTEEKQ